MLPDKLSFVDIETTGTSAKYGRIIEIGIIRVEDGKIVKTYNQLLNPQTHLPPEIELLTGIKSVDLENQPTFRQIKDEILETLIDSVFVAHNVRFDYSFLRYEFRRENIDFKLRHFCTVKLSRTLFPSEKHHNLDSIISRFGFTCESRHRAYNDAKILWDFYQQSQSLFKPDTFISAVNTALRRPSIPILLKQDDLDILPEQPGVYIFYAENGMPLYVGKSIDIKDRVLSHFSADVDNAKDMNIAQQVKSIETIPTAGELGALFLESNLIKTLMPLYNRMLRHKQEMNVLLKTKNELGYESVKLVPFQTIDIKNLDLILGVFKSKKEAKSFLGNICKEFGLCEKLLGLEKTNNACFAYRLQRCKGACINKEPIMFYNLRFTSAFYKTKIRPWPFNGPVIIRETNTLLGFTECFLIDKWCYLGKTKIQNENLSDIPDFNEDGGADSEYAFDYDMYKLIVKFLNKPENFSKILVPGIQKIQHREQYESSSTEHQEELMGVPLD